MASSRGLALAQKMRMSDEVALVHCRLDGADDSANQRFVPLAEFELWRNLMELRHHRTVTVLEISAWVPEKALWWNSGFSAEELLPVLRLRFDRRTEDGLVVPMERFFAAETYPQAQEALLSHFSGRETLTRVVAVPGYFVPRALHQEMNAQGVPA